MVPDGVRSKRDPVVQSEGHGLVTSPWLTYTQSVLGTPWTVTVVQRSHSLDPVSTYCPSDDQCSACPDGVTLTSLTCTTNGHFPCVIGTPGRGSKGHSVVRDLGSIDPREFCGSRRGSGRGPCIGFSRLRLEPTWVVSGPLSRNYNSRFFMFLNQSGSNLFHVSVLRLHKTLFRDESLQFSFEVRLQCLPYFKDIATSSPDPSHSH